MFSHNPDHRVVATFKIARGLLKSKTSPMRAYSLKLSSILLLTAGLSQFNGTAQNTNMPYDFGTVVNGFQDNFTNSARDPAWVPVGAGGDQYHQTNGVLSIGTFFAGNPN